MNGKEEFELEGQRKKLIEEKAFDIFEPEKIIEMKQKITTLENENKKLKSELELSRAEQMVAHIEITKHKRFQWIRNVKVNAWLIFNPAVVGVLLVAVGNESDTVVFLLGLYFFIWCAIGFDFGYQLLKHMIKKKII